MMAKGIDQSTLDEVCEELRPLYETGDTDSPSHILRNYPNPSKVTSGLRLVIEAILPGRLSKAPEAGEDIAVYLRERLQQACDLLLPEIERALPFRWASGASADLHTLDPSTPSEAGLVIEQFVKQLPGVREFVVDDVRAAYEGDPAAMTFAEVKLAYPGLLAIVSHRIAHELYLLDVPIVPRIMSEWIHSQTGVDINPGARIGRSFFIDHATGVVIGETAKIGDRVKLYQGVTLGAKSFPLDENGRPIKRVQRHPTVEDDVVIYANATILGGDTVIGAGSTIGGNVFLTQSVPAKSFVRYTRPELRLE